MIALRNIMLVAVACAAVIGVPAAAEEKQPPVSAENCRLEHETCRADCERKHFNDEAKRAACLSVCSARYAACDAKAAYDKARPWLEDTARKTKKFLEDLLKDMPVPGKDAPPPKPKKPESI